MEAVGCAPRAGMHYVLLNLVGVGIFYAVLGTLNMADLAVRMSQAPLENAALLRAAGLILFAVFALKATLRHPDRPVEQPVFWA